MEGVGKRRAGSIWETVIAPKTANGKNHAIPPFFLYENINIFCIFVVCFTQRVDIRKDFPMNEIREGIVLMTVGMGTVLLFLSLMVMVIQATSSILSRYSHLFPEPVPVKPKRPAGKRDDLEQIAVAIAVAKARSE